MSHQNVPTEDDYFAFLSNYLPTVTSNSSDPIEPSSIEQSPIEPSYEDLNLRTQQVSQHIQYLDEKCAEISRSINYQDRRLAQLVRQHNHGSQLLSTFDEFLVEFEEQTHSYIYCGNWFAQLILLREQFNTFDNDGEILVQHLNDNMETLFNQFIQIKNQLRSSQSLINLTNVSTILQFFDEFISIAEEELDDIIDYVSASVQEERNMIGQFVEVMQAICRAIELTITSTEIDGFNRFPCLDFIQEFSSTLSQIQLI